MRSAVLPLVLVSSLCCRREPTTVQRVDNELSKASANSTPPPRHCPDGETLVSLGEVATPPGDWLRRLSTAELYVRVPSGTLDHAPASDNFVLRSYPSSVVRGKRVNDRQVTLLAEARVYAVGEAVRVVHVLEVFATGQELFVIGPKPITGEWVDEKLATPPLPAWGAFTMGVYDGAVVQSPGVDVNFEISSYKFADPGLHHVQWRTGAVDSNVLCIDVR